MLCSPDCLDYETQIKGTRNHHSEMAHLGRKRNAEDGRRLLFRSLATACEATAEPSAEDLESAQVQLGEANRENERSVNVLDVLERFPPTSEELPVAPRPRSSYYNALPLLPKNEQELWQLQIPSRDLTDLIRLLLYPSALEAGLSEDVVNVQIEITRHDFGHGDNTSWRTFNDVMARSLVLLPLPILCCCTDASCSRVLWRLIPASWLSSA